MTEAAEPEQILTMNVDENIGRRQYFCLIFVVRLHTFYHIADAAPLCTLIRPDGRSSLELSVCFEGDKA